MAEELKNIINKFNTVQENPENYYTRMLLHCEGINGSQTFIDSSPRNHIITANGNAQIDTAYKQFGTGSGLFDGTGDYISTPASYDLNLGSEDFAIECWVRFDALPNVDGEQHIIYSQHDSWDDCFHISLWVNASIERFWTVYGNSGGSNYIAFSRITSLAINTWYHIAVIRNGNEWKIFQDGTQVGATETNSSTIPNLTSPITIGGGESWNMDFNGRLDEVRVSIGTPRFSSEFTPSSAPYQTYPSINNKFNTVIEVLSDDINNKINFSKTILNNINNKFNLHKLDIINIKNNFRMITEQQVPGDAGLQSLGKSYFTVKINNIDITESLNLDIDSLRWKEVLNGATDADFNLGIPYDSANKPILNTTVEILFNNHRKFYGYITNISKSVEPEGINIHAEGEYRNINKELMNFSIGHNETYSNLYDALVILGFDKDIGHFIPVPVNFQESGKADAISNIVTQCGSFAWFIKPDGTKVLWQGGTGNIINLERQEIGTNLGIYQVINHNIKEDETTPQIDNIKVIMGDDIWRGYDNAWNAIGIWTAFKLKEDNDPTIYKKTYYTDAGWVDNRDETYQSEEVNLDGWITIIPAGFEAGSDITKELIPRGDGWEIYWTTGVANENIQDVIQTVAWYSKGGIYPEGKKEHIFYIGVTGIGTISKSLNLSNLTRQYGCNYKNWSVLPSTFGWEKTVPSTHGGDVITVDLNPPNIIIPSWDDTDYATDLGNWELSKYNTVKKVGSLTITFDCADIYGLDLSKRIMCEGILDEATNIKSIDYDVGNYLVTINLESTNYYKRTVGISYHE